MACVRPAAGCTVTKVDRTARDASAISDAAQQPRILVLGGAGMLGHKMFQVLARRFANTACTIRSQPDESVLVALAGTPGRVIEGVDVSKIEEFMDLLRQL